MVRTWTRSLLNYIIKITGVYYKAPANFTYSWNFGFVAFFFLLFQIVTGIFLSMFYSADLEVVFGVVLAINNELYYGWWLRFLHANGASFFFMAVYLHMARGLYYGSFAFPRQALWISGVIIWVLMIATAFLGYVLPWGQMSFWAAMVITSLLASIPVIGTDLILLLWGEYSLGGLSLHRFYTLHFTLPFIILAVVIIHFVLLHEFGSNNWHGVSVSNDFIPFIPYYGIKDYFSLFIVIIFFLYYAVFNPDLLGHPDNFILANPLVTPAHIVPEWYFLPLYAILRAVTNKLLGIALIGFVIVCLIITPYICKNYSIRTTAFRPLYSIVIWLLFLDCILLAWIGSMPVIVPYATLSTWFTIYLFFSFLVLLPIFFTADEFIYCKNSYNSVVDNDSSFSSGVRLCNIDLSEFVNKTNPRRRFIKYNTIKLIKVSYV